MRLWNRLAFLLAATALAGSACQVDSAEGRVRPPECADDRWYPSDPDRLAKQIDGFLEEADPPSLPSKPAALIAPHAGIAYSGKVAAAAFKTLQGHPCKRAVVLGFSHSRRFRGGAILKDVTAYATPLGEIPVDRAACDRLLKLDVFSPHPEVHRREHSLEIELPFLQRVLKDFTLVPIMVGQVEPPVFEQMAQALAPLVDENTVLVASSDFTHFGRGFLFMPFTEDIPENLKRIDFSAAEKIMALDADGFLKQLDENGVGRSPEHRRPQTVCGRAPITLMIQTLNRAGTYKGVRLAYDTSGRMTGDYNHSVSYMAIGFVKTSDKPKAEQSSAKQPPPAGSLAPEERRVLLRIARDSALAALSGKKRVDPFSSSYTVTDRLKQKGGAFVTLRNHGRLRGCIGHILPREALAQSVAGNAVNAATRDYRFSGNPVTAEEMKDIAIEISVLSPPKAVKSPSEIQLGRHGVILSRGLRRSVFLPQVATETGWDLETFLSRLSLKAGLSADAWKKSGTRFEVFTAEVFGEREGSHAAQ